jgi:hypothetical protein
MNSKEDFIQEIEELKNTKEKGDYFLKTLVSEFYPDEDINYLDGSGDGGIDAYFTDYNESTNTWVIIQSKYGSSYRGVDSICGEFSKIFVHLEDKTFRGLDDSFIYFRDFLNDITNKEKRVLLIILTCDKIKDSELISFKTISNVFSEKYNVKFEVENLYFDLLFNEKDKFKKSYEIRLPGNFIMDDGSGELVGKVSIKNLVNLMKTYESLTGDIKLFYKSNIRLQLKNKLANNIIDTISKEPDKLFQRNNGITILTDGIKYDSDNVLILTNPDCINGCQTSSNIYNYAKKSKIPDANICITVIDVSNLLEEDKRKITECRNKQTAVKNVGGVFIFDNRVENIKNSLSKYGKILQIKKGEYSPKKIDFIDLLSICFCIIGRKPGAAKSKSEQIYNSKTGDDYLTKLNNNNDFLLLTYKLAEICELLRKPSYKYYTSALRYIFISVLYILLEESYKREFPEKDIKYNKLIDILNNDYLLNYFMSQTKAIINNYTKIIGLMSVAKYTEDYNDDNLERLSKKLDLSTAKNLNNLIADWYNSKYDLDIDTIKKVKNIIKD